MALIDDVQDVCRRLAPHGWAGLLAEHGLDITAPDLAEELAKDVRTSAATSSSSSSSEVYSLRVGF
jgi:hypothetical protein